MRPGHTTGRTSRVRRGAGTSSRRPARRSRAWRSSGTCLGSVRCTRLATTSDDPGHLGQPASVIGEQCRPPCRRRAAAREGIAVTVDDSARELPHFDPDLAESSPETVLRFRSGCESASGVCSRSPSTPSGSPARSRMPSTGPSAADPRPQDGHGARCCAAGPRRQDLRDVARPRAAGDRADVTYRALSPSHGGDRDSDGDVPNPVSHRGAAGSRRRARGRACPSRSPQHALRRSARRQGGNHR